MPVEISALSVRAEVDRHYGKYRGVVVDNDDPNGLARLRARVPEVLGDVESGWALPSVPYAGPDAGVHLVPPPGAGVWVEFEAGDVSRPIWTGCWWSSDTVPKDDSGSPAKPAMKILKSEQGLMVRLDDEGKTVSICDADASNAVTITVDSGEVTVLAASKVVVEAPSIELTENASHAVVYGDDLLTFLNQVVQNYTSHTHPGQANAGGPVSPAPPLPPMQPPTPALLSTKVKTG